MLFGSHQFKCNLGHQTECALRAGDEFVDVESFTIPHIPEVVAGRVLVYFWFSFGKQIFVFAHKLKQFAVNFTLKIILRHLGVKLALIKRASCVLFAIGKHNLKLFDIILSLAVSERLLPSRIVGYYATYSAQTL